jgi:hypothetical protein
VWQSGRVPDWEEDEPRTWSSQLLAAERTRPKRGQAERGQSEHGQGEHGQGAAPARRPAPTPAPLPTPRPAPRFGGGPDDPTMLQSLRIFTQRYGWRAYALPLLAVITVLALMKSEGPRPGAAADPAAGAAHSAVPSAAPGDIALKADQPGSGDRNTAIAPDALPDGPPYTLSGTGTFRVLPGTSPVVGTGPVRRYSVEVENGVVGIDLAEYARQVQSVLSDPRGWAGHGGVALERIDTGTPDLHVTLSSAKTVHRLCGNSLGIETSCFLMAAPDGSDVNRVIINDARWVRGDAAYVGDLNAYHVYLINHESGHALGHVHAHQCLPGGLAPVMMQQTIGLTSAATHKLCQANPWPYPPGVAAAPGAEQPDTAQNSGPGLNHD